MEEIEKQEKIISDFEKKRELLIKNKENAMNVLKKAETKYENIKNDDSIDRKELRLEVALNAVNMRKHNVQRLSDQIELLRPEIEEDIKYRERQYNSFDKKIKEVVPDDLHLCFHGAPITAAKHIIEDKGISSSVDRLGTESSYDVSDQVSVTTKNTIETTLRGYSGLVGNYNLPAGCIFAIRPKDENEIASSESSMLIGNVDFKQTPERLYSIITTPENIKRVSEWMEEAGIDISKLHDYDGFIKEMELLNEKQGQEKNGPDKMFTAKQIGKATINIPTAIKDKSKEQMMSMQKQIDEQSMQKS